MKDKVLIAAFICVAILFSGCVSLPSIGLWGSPTSTPQPTRSFDAILVNETIPASMVLGHSYKVSITMRNTGYSSWSSDDQIVLVPKNDPTNDAMLLNNTVLTISPGVIVKTGSDYTWNITMRAPGWNGNCTVSYQMRAGNDTYFGSSISKDIIVGSLDSVVAFVPQDFTYYPALRDMSIKAGMGQNVSVTVMNQGRYDWSEADEVRLAVVDYEPNDATLFCLTTLFHIAPEAIVPAGDQCTWRFRLTAPNSPGTYHIKYRMIKGDQWFGSTLSATITVI